MRRGLALAAAGALPLAAGAQALLPSAAPVTETFDGLGTAAAAAVPTGFLLSAEAVPTYGSAANYAATTVATTGNNFTAGGTYNFGAVAGSADRALGFLNSGSYTSPRHILLAVKNTSGAVVQDLAVQFDIEKYRSGSRAYDWKFYVSTDGVTWAAQTAGDQNFTADANNTVYSYPPLTTTKQVALTGLNLAADATYYLRWSDVGAGGSTNGQGLALDNLVLTPTLGTGTGTPTASITTAATAYGSPYCLSSSAGSASFAVAYDATGFAAGATFKAQLSSAAGVFPANATDNIIGSGAASPLAATLPAGTLSGSGYRIRVVSDAPLTFGTDNGQNLAINLAPATNPVTVTPIASQSVTSTGTGVALTATAGAPSAFAWYYGTAAAGPYATALAGATAATYQVSGANFPAAGTYYVVAQATSVCGAVVGLSAPVAVTVTAPVVVTKPTLTASLTTLADFGSTASGAASLSKSFTLSSANLTGPVTVTPAAGFEIRVGAQAFACCAIQVTPVDGAVNATVDVRFVPTAAQAFAASLAVQGPGVPALAVAVSGTGVAPVYPASVSSVAVTALAPTTATAGGTVDADGGSAVTARGVVWSKTANPTLTATKTTDGAGSGTFASALTGLLPGTAYFVRAYATNAAGTAYGDELTFTTANIPLAAEPTASASLTASAVTSNSLHLTVAGGNGAKRLILARLTTAVNAAPVDATTYAADATFGVGPQIGTGNYVVYNGTGTGVTVTGLRAGNTYTFAVFEYNDNDTPFAENYRTTAPGTLTQGTTAASAALLLEENFAYPAGALLTANDWTAHSGAGTNAVGVVAPGLSYAGYGASGIGNAAAIVASGEDVGRGFAPVAPRTPVYVSYLVNVASATTAGDYYFHLGPAPLSTNFRSRVFVRRNAATGKVQFGISGSAAATYGTTDYELNTTYLLVVKYSFDETGNLAQLFVNPPADAEPATADVSAAEAASTSPANIGTVALRQGASSPNLVVDGLRVGTAYQVVRAGAACTTPVITAPVVPVATAQAGLRGAPVAFAATATGSSVLTYSVVVNGTTTAITSPYVFPLGTTVVTATATNDCGTASLPFSVTVQSPTVVSVLHQNADYLPNDDTVRPNLDLVNNSAEAIPYQELTVRYWLTPEDFAPILTSVDYAQLGTSDVKMRYVPLAQPVQGAFGYVEYSFTSPNSLPAGGNSGQIRSRIYKETYTRFDQTDDYSYSYSRAYAPNDHLTVYRNGVLIGGVEPAPVALVTSLQVLSQTQTTVLSTQTISTYVQLKNVGNQPVPYQDLAVRYWFSPEGAAALRSSVDYAVLGSSNVNVTFGQSGTETFAEIRFNPALGSLAPRSTTGNVQYRLYKDDWSFFDQANDFSYMPFSLQFAANDHLSVYQQGRLVYGQEPAGAAGASATMSRGPQATAATGAPVGSAVVQAVRSYPNPFTGSTTLAFALAQGAAYQLDVYDGTGRLVQHLATGQAAAGELVRTEWQATGLAPGLYLARLTTGGTVQNLKLVKQ
nr:cellulose binding domain-containing protein [Hymenobacter sp. PAMC 26628]